MWILVAALPPLFWAFNNFADEYMAKHHFAKNGVLLILLSASFEIVPSLAGISFYDAALDVTVGDRAILGLLGFFFSLSFIPYIFALQCSNASNAATIYQTIPVFAFILGWVFLGEGATLLQLSGAFIIIGAAVGISWNYKESRIDIKPLCLMLLSSIMIAGYLIATRYYTFQYDPMVMNTWLWFGSGFLSICSILFYKFWRQQSMDTLRTATGVLIAVFFFQIISQLCAGALWIKALAMAPSAALMDTIGGTQAAYLLLLSIILGRIFPAYFDQVTFDKALFVKSLLICAILVGVYMISI